MDSGTAGHAQAGEGRDGCGRCQGSAEFPRKGDANDNCRIITMIIVNMIIVMMFTMNDNHELG